MNNHEANSHNCMFCGYDMRGLADGRCPECGEHARRFTDRAREVVRLANTIAIQACRHELPGQRKPGWFSETPWRNVDPWHVLAGIVDGPKGLGYHAMLHCGVEIAPFRQSLITGYGSRARVHVDDDIKLPGSHLYHVLVNDAIQSSLRLAQHWVGTEHLLLGLCSSDDRIVRRAMHQAGISGNRIKEFLRINAAATQHDDSNPTGADHAS